MQAGTLYHVHVDCAETASGFIFDCDGTLVDSMGLWRNVEDELFAMSDLEVSQERLSAIRAMSLEDAIEVLNAHGMPYTIEEVFSRIESRLLQFYREEVQPIPGAPGFVRGIHELGIPCAVVTASAHRYLEPALRRCGIYDCFSCMLSVDDVPGTKHDPGIYVEALGAIGADPRSAWGVDDSLYAIREMSGVGMHTIGCYEDDGAGSWEQLERAATVAVRSLSQLSPAEFSRSR